MNYKNLATKFDFLSKVCAVMLAAAIVLSTAATVILLPASVFLSFLAGNLKEKIKVVLSNPASIMFLLFFSMFLFGVLYTTAAERDSLLILRKYSKFLLAPFLVPLFMSKQWRGYAVNAFLGAALVLLIFSYLRSWGLISFAASNGLVEVFKPSIEFNFLLAFAAYFCFYKIITDKRWRVAWVVFLLIITHTILFRSIGRSGYFVFGSLSMLFFFQQSGLRGLLLSLFGCVLLGGFAFLSSATFKNRINAIVNDVSIYRRNYDTSVGLRMVFLANSLKSIKKHPLLGEGTGSFARSYREANPDFKLTVSNPHNEYIHVAVQLGSLGLMMLLLLFLVPLWYSKYLPDESKYIVRGVVLGLMLGCLANSWLLDVTEGNFFAYFIMLAFAAYPATQKKRALIV